MSSSISQYSKDFLKSIRYIFRDIAKAVFVLNFFFSSFYRWDRIELKSFETVKLGFNDIFYQIDDAFFVNWICKFFGVIFTLFCWSKLSELKTAKSNILPRWMIFKNAKPRIIYIKVSNFGIRKCKDKIVTLKPFLSIVQWLNVESHMTTYSDVMQSDGNSFCGDVELDSFEHTSSTQTQFYEFLVVMCCISLNMYIFREPSKF